MLQLKLLLLACARRAFRSIAVQVLIDFRVHLGLNFGSILEVNDHQKSIKKRDAFATWPFEGLEGHFGVSWYAF